MVIPMDSEATEQLQHHIAKFQQEKYRLWMVPPLEKYPFTADDDDDDSRPSMFSADLLVADEAPSLARSSWKSDITHDHCSPA